MSDPGVPPLLFAPVRGGRLAYQDFGGGKATIVAIPPLAQNIEMAWERPEIGAMLRRFASFSRYIHFDKRGTGCSDRRSEVNGIDERVEDLRAVMDHAGVESAHLFANSEGGPMAILFAATYPGRVDSLILSSTGATIVPADMTPEERSARTELHKAFAALWGTPMSPVVDGFAPSLAGDMEFREWHQRYERNAASSDSLQELLDLTMDMDVREVLGDIQVPTLVVHRTGDQIQPIESGRFLADSIPGAVLFETDGVDHFSYAGDIDPWMREVERFVTGGVKKRTPSQARPSRVRIRTLGRFAVEVDGQEVAVSAWGSRLSRQLCKRLVAARGWPVTREELIDFLWPGETDMGRLGARLSVQLSAVRRVLNGGVIADRQSVRLNMDEVSVDLEDLYRSSTDPDVVAVYTGEFLPDDVYEDWTRGVRDEARTRFVTAARRLCAAHASDGLHENVATLARRLVALDRYDTDAHRVLVDALMAMGEKGEAERAHRHWADAMAELDIDVPAFEAGS